MSEPQSVSGYTRGRPDLSWWIRQIEAGQRYRSKFAYEARWEQWRQYYRCNWRSGTMPENVFFKMVRSIIPRIYFRNPSVSVQSALPGPESLAFSRILDRVDNKMIRQMKMKTQMKAIVQDAWFHGTGIGKLGFGSAYAMSPEAGGTFQPYSTRGEAFEYDSNIFPQMPFFSRVYTGDYVVPPGTGTFDTARWSAEWVVRNVHDVKGDRRFNNTKDLGPSSRGSLAIPIQRPPKMDGQEDDIDLLEIRDKKFRKVMVFAPFNSDKHLYYGPDALQVHGKIPYYHAVFNPDSLVCWGIPDAITLEPDQLEANDIRTGITLHRRLSLIRLLVRREGMKPEEALKLVDEVISPVIWTEGDPAAVVRVMEGADIPDGILKARAINQESQRDTLGMSRNQMGDFSETKSHSQKTAQEVQTVDQAANLRVDERRDTMADMLVDTVHGMHTLLFSEWTTETVIDVVGPFGIPFWVRFSPQMLKQGNYEVNVDPDNAVPETKALRENKALIMYERLKTNPLIDPYKLTSYLLHEMHGVAYDDMMVGIPPGQGLTQNKPLNIEQFSSVLTQAGQRGLPQPGQSVGAG